MPRQRRKIDLRVARFDRAHALAPNLFLSLRRGTARLWRQIEYELPGRKGAVVRWAGPTLDARDQDVLLAVLEAGFGGSCEVMRPTELGSELTTTLHRLGKGAGLARSGSRVEAVAASLDHLAGVTVSLRAPSGATTWQMPVLRWRRHEDGTVRIALNSALASALIGIDSAAAVPMVEHRALRTAGARLIHTWLCAWLGAGAEAPHGGILLSTLAQHVWPAAPEPTPVWLRARRRWCRAALMEIADLPGWTVQFVAPGDKVLIRRPQVPHLWLARRGAPVLSLPRTRRALPAGA